MCSPPLSASDCLHCPKLPSTVPNCLQLSPTASNLRRAAALAAMDAENEALGSVGGSIAKKSLHTSNMSAHCYMLQLPHVRLRSNRLPADGPAAERDGLASLLLLGAQRSVGGCSAPTSRYASGQGACAFDYKITTQDYNTTAYETPINHYCSPLQ